MADANGAFQADGLDGRFTYRITVEGPFGRGVTKEQRRQLVIDGIAVGTEDLRVTMSK